MNIYVGGNVWKRLRESGQEYIRTNGERRRARILKEDTCCHREELRKCYRYHELEDKRQELFADIYDIYRINFTNDYVMFTYFDH